ncbi:MAG TPA: PEP-CTERM sorting domain-containing protein [Bryobacteraceae bacterium]|nr:PEP-CTERM sorting domain-containing protein [Bryobacteraceae bacterium]
MTTKLLLLAGLLATSSLSAAVVPCPTSAAFDLLTVFNSAANACFSQDVMFWDFIYTPDAGAPAATGVTSSLIFQTSPLLDIHGWNFDGVWVGPQAGFTLSYAMEVCPTSGQPCSGIVTPGTSITAADATYAPVSVLPPGQEVVTWSNGATVTLTSSSPGPLPPNGNIGLPVGFTGPITVTAVFAGTGGITQTSLRFYETAGQAAPVPEPTHLSMLICGLGFIGIAGWRRLKRAS